MLIKSIKLDKLKINTISINDTVVSVIMLDIDKLFKYLKLSTLEAKSIINSPEFKLISDDYYKFEFRKVSINHKKRNYLSIKKLNCLLLLISKHLTATNKDTSEANNLFDNLYFKILNGWSNQIIKLKKSFDNLKINYITGQRK